MESKTKGYLFAISSLAVIIIVFGYLNAAQEVQKAPKELSECTPLNYKPENQFNLIYIGSEEDAKEYNDFLRTTQPYSEYSDRINTMFVNAEPPTTIYKGIATYADNEKVLALAASCPNANIIIALKKESSNTIRSSAKDNRIGINTQISQAGEVQTHEMGHAVAGLQEEYVALSGDALRNKEPNCKKNTNDFNVYDEIAEGCTYENLKRSIEAGVMRTLSSNYYGKFNENIVKKVLDKEAPQDSQVTGRAVDLSEECADKQFILYNVKDNAFKVFQGCHIDNLERENDQAKYQIIQDGVVLEEKKLSTVLYTDTQLQGQEIISGETYKVDDILLTLPYPPQGDTIKVFDENGQQIAQANLNQAGATACIL